MAFIGAFQIEMIRIGETAIIGETDTMSNDVFLVVFKPIYEEKKYSIPWRRTYGYEKQCIICGEWHCIEESYWNMCNKCRHLPSNKLTKR
jgi:hypothetical protein